MTNKKKILIFIIAFIALIAIGVAIAFVINSKSTKNKESATPTSSSQGSESVANLTLTEAGTIPLGDESANKNDDSGLKVSNGQSSNPASLGSGLDRNQSSASPSSSSDSSNKNTIPGPETFGQYEKYKDGQSSLFGDLQVGTGSEVAAGKKVAVYYKGYLTNGQLFDQSVDKTFVFTVGAKQVIPGWEQSIMGMKVGGVRRMIIPPSVGYGAQGQGPIPGNAVLVFDVQLAAVE